MDSVVCYQCVSREFGQFFLVTCGGSYKTTVHCNLTDLGVLLALGVGLETHLSSTHLLCVKSSSCVCYVRSVVPSLQSVMSTCATNEVICPVYCDVPV